MKKTFRQLLVAATTLLAASFAATAAPPTSPGERTPTVQQFTLFNRGVETVGFKVAPTGQPQVANQLVKQRHFDPPVMIQTVLPLGATSSRTPWLEATADAVSMGLIKMKPFVIAKSPDISNLWDLAMRDRQKVPDPSDVIMVKAIPDDDGITSVAAKGAGGSSCIDRMPSSALIT